VTIKHYFHVVCYLATPDWHQEEHLTLSGLQAMIKSFLAAASKNKFKSLLIDPVH